MHTSRVFFCFAALAVRPYCVGSRSPSNSPTALPLRQPRRPHSVIAAAAESTSGRQAGLWALPTGFHLFESRWKTSARPHQRLQQRARRERGANERVRSDLRRHGVFPVQISCQALPLPNTFCGISWNPNGSEFYVSGGVDDKIYIFARNDDDTFSRHASVALGHAHGKAPAFG